ncbi:response regulator [bacterium]|nr:response regulator [bacterium]
MIRILIVEDDIVSRKLLKKTLEPYGPCDIATNGLEALSAFASSLHSREYYDLICLDIMMPKLNGLETLKQIREIEKTSQIPSEDAVKILMTTILADPYHVLSSFREGCEAYLTKPFKRSLVIAELIGLDLIQSK